MMFHRRSSIRRIAIHLLLLWVFAIGAGIANACGLASKATSAEHVVGDVASTIADHHHVQPAIGDDEPIDQPGRSTCIKFCGDAKAVTTLPDPIGDLPATAVVPLWQALRPDVQQTGGATIAARVEWPGDRPVLSIAIEYLRLAL